MSFDALAAEASIPAIALTSVGTTWTEILLPSWTRYVTIMGDKKIYVAFRIMTEGETPAASDPKILQEPKERMEYKIGSLTQSVFVAGESQSADLELIAEPRT